LTANSIAFESEGLHHRWIKG